MKVRHLKLALMTVRIAELIRSLLGPTVYATPSRSLFIALPRSPVIRARRANYLESMQRWVAESGFKEVLIVAGADAAMRGDDGLNALSPPSLRLVLDRS